MIGQMCAECKNYFIQKNVDIHYGYYTISEGSIMPVSFLLDGQYYRIVGSVLNDGVYKHGTDDTELQDEEFYGAVWSMRVPKDFIELSEEIEAWQTANADALNSPYTSESFGGYSYTKASGENGSGSYTWKDQFKSKLDRYRRLFVI